jgi:DNA-binding IclR family transcriptional regulator
MLQTLQRLGYVRNVNGRFEVTPACCDSGPGTSAATSLAARAQPASTS